LFFFSNARQQPSARASLLFSSLFLLRDGKANDVGSAAQGGSQLCIFFYIYFFFFE
jgi:hypothetical protein